jgi:hypothetical protein
MLLMLDFPYRYAGLLPSSLKSSGLFSSLTHKGRLRIFRYKKEKSRQVNFGPKRMVNGLIDKASLIH